MVRMLYTCGVLALTLAGAVLILAFVCRSENRSKSGEREICPPAIETFASRSGYHSGSPGSKGAPLVVQAQALALYLNPPRSPERPMAPAPVASSAPAAPAIRPAAPSAKFRLCAISYYPNQPGRSMALIAELGSDPGNEHWVKEGAQVGHFTIHEIRRGAIVYRDGDNLREMAVERRASLPSIVRDLRPGSIRVSAAVGGTDSVTPALAGPNGIEIAGGN
jgi:hypothetical protein